MATARVDRLPVHFDRDPRECSARSVVRRERRLNWSLPHRARTPPEHRSASSRSSRGGCARGAAPALPLVRRELAARIEGSSEAADHLADLADLAGLRRFGNDVLDQFEIVDKVTVGRTALGVELVTQRCATLRAFA